METIIVFPNSKRLWLKTGMKSEEQGEHTRGSGRRSRPRRLSLSSAADIAYPPGGHGRHSHEWLAGEH